jgi:transposase
MRNAIANSALGRDTELLTAEERELARELEKLTRTRAPQLLDQPASDRSRPRSSSSPGRTPAASKARPPSLASPAAHRSPASSGQTIRYRLDRSGDRQLNRALHMILVTRQRTHPPTIAYINRRIHEGKSRREANRCLKRYLARSLYPLLEHAPMTP